MEIKSSKLTLSSKDLKKTSRWGLCPTRKGLDMSNYNWKWYVDNDDLDGCIKRLEQAYKNWKSHWFETCLLIYQNNIEKWSLIFQYDENEMTFIKVIHNYHCENKISTAYVVTVYDERLKNYILKIGKANDIYRRFSGDKYYYLVEIHAQYEFDSEDKALSMENLLRSHLKSIFPNRHKQRDRFLINFEDIPYESWEFFNQKVDEINILFG